MKKEEQLSKNHENIVEIIKEKNTINETEEKINPNLIYINQIRKDYSLLIL